LIGFASQPQAVLGRRFGMGSGVSLRPVPPPCGVGTDRLPLRPLVNATKFDRFLDTLDTPRYFDFMQSAATTHLVPALLLGLASGTATRAQPSFEPLQCTPCPTLTEMTWSWDASSFQNGVEPNPRSGAPFNPDGSVRDYSPNQVRKTADRERRDRRIVNAGIGAS